MKKQNVAWTLTGIVGVYFLVMWMGMANMPFTNGGDETELSIVFVIFVALLILSLAWSGKVKG